jgi:hypothetical protein
MGLVGKVENVENAGIDRSCLPYISAGEGVVAIGRQG